MGNRQKGKPKKKSIKAASHSRMGSKRKLSRMGKVRKKGNAGLEATFIGRSKCLKKLQISLKDFRRLCILKGIYPREPLGGKAPGNKKGQTYYHIKDIRAIAHEPILEKFREIRAFMKKVRRAAGRNEKDEAARKHALAPSYTIHHLVRERYPRFVDALADLDDALTLTYLFAALPSDKGIKAKVINKAKTLAASWGAYCATTAAITKSFISVKGIYLEAEIQGTPIRWIVPHSFTQHVPDDVDYKVMMTFFEFYETLLGFVMFKLYNDLGVRYPLSPADLGKDVKGSTTSILGANLMALTNVLNSSAGAIGNVVAESLKDSSQQDSAEAAHKIKANKKSLQLVKTVGTVLDQLKSDESGEDEGEDEDEDLDVASPLKAALESMVEDGGRTDPASDETVQDDSAAKRKRLFAGLTFFFSREVPRGYLELVGLAYGAKVGWEGPDSPIAISDARITHHFVDRPRLPSSYDSLPKSREFIQPQWLLDCANFTFLLPVARYATGNTLPPHLSPWVNDEEEGYKPAYAEEIERLKNGEILEDIMASEKLVEASSDEDELTAGSKEEIDVNEADESESGHDDDEDSEEDEEKMTAREEKKRKRGKDEEHELAKVMMSKKAARLYSRMQHGIAQKKAKSDILHQRRKELDRTKAKNESGQTVLKQKVERLREERKEIEKKYSSHEGSMKKKNQKKKKHQKK